MTAAFDRRVIAARPDLAAAHLAGTVAAARFVEGRTRRLAVPSATLSFQPRDDARRESELLFGEAVQVYEERDGWAWVQSATDDYVGWLPAAALGEPGPAPTHVVAALRSHLYPDADLKLRPLHPLFLGSPVTVVAEAGRFSRLAGGGCVPAKHLAPAGMPEPDFVATALGFLGVPYLWGGRTPDGLDCSALVQLALARAGHPVPRDSDQQQQTVGSDAGDPADPARRRHGDLMYFPGHVGIVLDGGRFLHANAFEMRVAVHALDDVLARAAADGAPPTHLRRIAAG